MVPGKGTTSASAYGRQDVNISFDLIFFQSFSSIWVPVFFHQITSLSILPTGRWIRVFLIFRLALVQLLMLLLIWSSLFLIPDQLFLTSLPLSRILMGVVIPVEEVPE